MVEPPVKPVCAICNLRCSEWMIAAGKTTVINGRTFHNACLLDWAMKHGSSYETQRVN